MPADWPPQFLFTVCQCGAELALKQEIAKGPIDARPAYMRPGFVTFKLGRPCDHPDQFQLPSTFARTFGFCLGKVTGELSGELARQVWQLPAVEQFMGVHLPGDIHVWQRDTKPAGSSGFQPGPTLLAREIETVLRQASPVEVLRSLPAEPRPPSRRSRWVLDVVLVEPNEWWVGCHRTVRRIQCWPGGVMPLELPEHAASRAYLKITEAIAWSALPAVPGDLCLELGCAPGGASQALLDHGLKVIGIDPAEIDDELASHPGFTHLRCRSLEVPHKALRGVRWLVADMNTAPTYTLDAAEAIVGSKTANIRGMILTLKLADWKLAEQLPEFVRRVMGWGYRDVRTRQLASNRQEVCLVALRSRGQRRVQRRSRPRSRTDEPHASGMQGPHLPTNM